MESLHVNSTILSLFRDKNQNIQENYFRKDSIVLSIFRFLNQIEQTIIIKNLSHNEENIYLNFKKEKHAIENLRSFGILKKKDNLYILNKVFKKTLIKCLSNGRKKLFEKKNIEMEIETSEKDSFKILEKWINLYNYMLKNVGCDISSIKLNKDVERIIEKEQLIVKMDDDYQENSMHERKYRRSSGFAFLVQPIHIQINTFILYYVQYLINEKLSKFNPEDKLKDIELLEFICQFNFMSKNNYYIPNFDKISLPKKFCIKILKTLDSLGLIQFSEFDHKIFLTDLFVNFLDPLKKLSGSYKSHIIIENDFKLYAYSKMEYLVYLLGKIKRTFY